MNSIQQGMQAAVELARKGQLGVDQGTEVARYLQLASFVHGLLSNTPRWTAEILECIDQECGRLNLDLFESDEELDAAGLQRKYQGELGQGEHPDHTRAYWQERVAEGDTDAGYWEWLEHNLDCDEREARGESLSIMLPGCQP